MTLQEILERSADRVGSKTFLFCGDKSITYENAVKQGRKAAGALSSLGVKKGDRVAFHSINSIDFVLAMLGCWNLGAICALIDPRHGDSLDYYFNDAGSKILLFSSDVSKQVEKKRKECRGLRRLVCFDGSARNLKGAVNWTGLVRSAKSVRKDIKETDPCHLSWTSGSTGQPKGAVLAHEPTAQATSCIAERLDLQHDEVTLGPTGLSSSYHLVANLLPGMIQSCTVGMMPVFNQTSAWKIIRKRKVNVFVANPLLLTDLYNEWRDKKLNKGTLRITISGGGPVPPDLKRVYQDRMKVPLVESFGQSELGGFVALGDPKPYSKKHFAAIGRPLPDKEVVIGDDNDRELPVGQIGEILIRRGFMWGYWGRPTATKKVLKNGWLHTGDIGRMDDNNYVFLLARKSERIYWGKKIVYPRIVEEALYFEKAVQYAALIPIPDKKTGEIPKAVVSLYQGKSTTEKSLRAVIKKQLSSSEIPPVIEIIDEMPMTATGKINKTALREREKKLRKQP